MTGSAIAILSRAGLCIEMALSGPPEEIPDTGVEFERGNGGGSYRTGRLAELGA